jgi:opacity protein-like surface antigen
MAILNKTLVVASLLLFSATADARSFYVGASIGQAIVDDSPPQVIGELDTDESWRIHAGWQFHENWAVEGVYHGFGDASGQFRPCPEACTPDIPVSREYSTDAWSLRAAWRLGKQRWQPFAAAGWTWSNSDGRVSGLGSGTRVGFSADDNGFSAELGMRVLLGDAFALRAGYEWFDLDAADGAFNIGGEFTF